MVKGRGEQSLIPSHITLGSLTESHSRKANFPLLTLSEFSADLGGILKRRKVINIQKAKAQNESFKGKVPVRLINAQSPPRINFKVPIKLENQGLRWERKQSCDGKDMDPHHRFDSRSFDSKCPVLLLPCAWFWQNYIINALFLKLKQNENWSLFHRAKVL